MGLIMFLGICMVGLCLTLVMFYLIWVPNALSSLRQIWATARKSRPGATWPIQFLFLVIARIYRAILGEMARGKGLIGAWAGRKILFNRPSNEELRVVHENFRLRGQTILVILRKIDVEMEPEFGIWAVNKILDWIKTQLSDGLSDRGWLRDESKRVGELRELFFFRLLEDDDSKLSPANFHYIIEESRDNYIKRLAGRRWLNDFPTPKARAIVFAKIPSLQLEFTEPQGRPLNSRESPVTTVDAAAVSDRDINALDLLKLFDQSIQENETVPPKEVVDEQPSNTQPFNEAKIECLEAIG